MLVKHSTISDKVYFEHPEFRDIKVPFKKSHKPTQFQKMGILKIQI